MSLQSELNALAGRIASFQEPPKITDEEWRKFCDDAVIALMAGGESSRYAAVLEGQNVNKNAHELPNGDTMIEMTIRMWRDAGLKKFVALVFHNAHSVEDLLGDGSRLGVGISYSYDPDPPAGKGGAIRNAMDNGSIPLDKRLIAVNPDDIFFDFPGSLPRYIAQAHLAGEQSGQLATVALVTGQPYHGTGMMVVDNKVVDTVMYPLIPVPYHAGITVFSKAVLPRFIDLFSLTEKNDFEQVLFPLLAKEKKLCSVGLKSGNLFAVNDLKAYRLLVEKLEKSKF